MQLCWIGTCLSQSSVLLVTGLAVLQDFSKLLAPNLFVLIFFFFFFFFSFCCFSFQFCFCYVLACCEVTFK